VAIKRRLYKKGRIMEFLEYWGLRERPFENTGSVKFFYYSPTHKEALVRLIYVIRNRKAGALLAGDFGTGKTTIANELLDELDQNEKYRRVYIRNPILTSRELLQEVAYQLGVNDSAGSRLILRRNIEEKLKQISDDGNHTVIVVDEAHLLSRKDVLEELRLFMNLQYNDRFMNTIIMIGQLELRDIINAMPQFKQRFAMYYLLKALDESETKRYIGHRLDIAGCTRPVFDDEASYLIHSSSAGRPRQVNNICDMALLTGFMRKTDIISGDLVREVVKDLGAEV